MRRGEGEDAGAGRVDVLGGDGRVESVGLVVREREEGVWGRC